MQSAIWIKKGIKVLTGTKMESITGTVKAKGVKTDKGELKADIVVMSLGIRPNTAFLKDTGLEFMPNGTIPVDGKLTYQLRKHLCSRRLRLRRKPSDRKAGMVPDGFLCQHGGPHLCKGALRRGCLL